MEPAALRRHPLRTLTLLALVPRLLASLFSGGYFAFDDHFLIIEAAASWVEAADYNTWLPWNQQGEATPGGHSFFYVGLHYLLLLALKSVGITDPKSVMVVVRVLHALWSLAVVRTGYRIAERLGGSDIAWHTGLFLALFFFMPFLSVRNLVEVACIPFLMWGAWQLLRMEEDRGAKAAFLAGMFLSLAINVRFQTIFFAAAPGLLLLVRRQWPLVLGYAAGIAVPLVVLQGGIDLFIWKRPFAEITAYVAYNLANATTYFDQPWYNYLLQLAGMFIPPFSLALLFGFFRRQRPLAPWLAVLCFLAFHSYFPNKQERFLLPIVPLYFVMAYGSWEQWRNASAWWSRHTGLWRGVMRFTWGLNLLLLPVITVSTSKQSRIDAMYLLRGGDPVKGIVVEDTREQEPPQLPRFYLGQWHFHEIPWPDASQDLRAELDRYPAAERPDHILFIGPEDLEARRARAEAAMGPLQQVGVAEPGLLDKVVHWLNPVNRNETILVYRAAR